MSGHFPPVDLITLVCNACLGTLSFLPDKMKVTVDKTGPVVQFKDLRGFCTCMADILLETTEEETEENTIEFEFDVLRVHVNRIRE